ncbi:MAG: YraN family protein [Chromatiales bacterium]|nr:YraN family protein [Chromatiales bacterium]
MRRRDPRRAAGLDAETLAARHLEQHGARIIIRNFRLQLGELDLVVFHQDCVAAVEVRYRRPGAPVNPLETITLQKRRRLVLIAQCFLLRHPAWSRYPLRFDVVAVSGPLDTPRVEWHPGAFDTSDLL